MKTRLIVLFVAVLAVGSVFAQSGNSVTFALEKLSVPAALLETKTIDGIYKELLREDYKSHVGSVDKLAAQCGIIANSFGDRQIVGEYGYNPFFFGL